MGPGSGGVGPRAAEPSAPRPGCSRPARGIRQPLDPEHRSRDLGGDPPSRHPDGVPVLRLPGGSRLHRGGGAMRGPLRPLFCQSTDVLGRMRDAGHTHGSLLPVAADPEVHFPVPIDAGATERWGAEVAFVGSFYPERAELLEAFTGFRLGIWGPGWAERLPRGDPLDRKSTRLNSSHLVISYAVFCLKKKKSSTYTHHTGARE